MSPDEAQQNLFPEATPPAQPKATEEQIVELLTRLRLRRAALVDSYVAGLGCDEPVSVSGVAPLGMVQMVIMAVEAELAQDEP